MPSKLSQKTVEPSVLMDRLETFDEQSEVADATCSEWLARHAEHEALTRQWQALESHLIHEHDWFRLSESERDAMPEAAELKAIEDRLNRLHERKQHLLCDLPSIAATTAQGLLLKLRVAAASVPPDENEEAHNLLRSAVEDLRAISGITTDVFDAR